MEVVIAVIFLVWLFGKNPCSWGSWLLVWVIGNGSNWWTTLRSLDSVPSCVDLRSYLLWTLVSCVDSMVVFALLFHILI